MAFSLYHVPMFLWFPTDFPIWPWVKTYGTIFGWLFHIHKSQLFWCEQKGYRVLTHNHIFPYVSAIVQRISIAILGTGRQFAAPIRREWWPSKGLTGGPLQNQAKQVSCFWAGPEVINIYTYIWIYIYIYHKCVLLYMYYIYIYLYTQTYLYIYIYIDRSYCLYTCRYIMMYLSWNNVNVV